jgi:hypothetical protein
MRPTEIHRAQVAWMIKEIRRQNGGREPGEWQYEFHDEKESGEIPSYTRELLQQQTTLEIMKLSGAIRILKMEETKVLTKSDDSRFFVPFTVPVPAKAYIEIIQPQFDSLEKELGVEEDESKIATEHISTKSVSKTKHALFVFLLSKEGVLERQTPVKGDISYSLEKNSRRHKVLRALSSYTSEGYHKTKELAEVAECSPVDFRKTCGELKKQLLTHFAGIKMDDVIEGKSRSGYRINPRARIVEIR